MNDLTTAFGDLAIETPSWGYADSGTRFGVFPQPGRPRNVYERIDDAAEVHRLTGTAGSVALHFPWDAVDDYEHLREHIHPDRRPRTCPAARVALGAVDDPLAALRQSDYIVRMAHVRDARQELIR